MIRDKEATINYIQDRRCNAGGYCFYRLDEPNAGDTFFALASLALLGALPGNNEDTRSYLHRFQRMDGTFPNVNVGHAVIRSLALFGERPSIDPAGWILSSLVPPRDNTRPVESSSSFESTYMLLDLCMLPGITIPADKKTVITGAVLRWQHPDTGFGNPESTIIETAHALFILAALGYPVSSTGSWEFLKQCEDPGSGFIAVPGSRPGYLEHIHAGVLACSVLGYHSPVLAPSEQFIERCRHENGGYVRSVFGGSATLENTWLALDALAKIDKIRRAHPRSDPGHPLRRCD